MVVTLSLCRQRRNSGNEGWGLAATWQRALSRKRRSELLSNSPPLCLPPLGEAGEFCCRQQERPKTNSSEKLEGQDRQEGFPKGSPSGPKGSTLGRGPRGSALWVSLKLGSLPNDKSEGNRGIQLRHCPCDPGFGNNAAGL